ncbi:MAG TPA: YjgN family protein [Deinococcales bacterium]|nr:YjgN family protein [Deinococcales bacterium]
MIVTHQTTEFLTPAALEAQYPGQVHRFEFTGSAGEYFRIWLVNVLLSVVTLGLYAAWAKVRTRRYFYANTVLDGHPFEYLARPGAILKGNLVVAAVAVLYYLLQGSNIVASLAILGAGMLLFPWLLQQSLRFTASNSAYRGLRFRFHGTTGQAYGAYLSGLLVTVVTFGLGFPYFVLRQKQFVFGNAAYGTARSRFTGRTGPVFVVYLGAAALYLLALTPFFALIGAMTAAVMSGDATTLAGFSLAAILNYAWAFLAFSIVQQYVFARVTNYCFRVTTLDENRLWVVSDLRARELAWLRVTNLLAIVCTLGLASAWAKVRYVKYVLARLTVCAPEGLEGFTAAEQERTSAIGEAVTDFLDFDLAL